MNIYIGIDPGKKGAVAAIRSDGVIEVCAVPMIGKEYNIHLMNQLIFNEVAENPHNLSACLEKGQAMPKQGTVSMFNFGKGCGIWEGILAAQSVSYEVIHPRTWQKEMLRDIPAGDTKHRALLAAKRLFPGVNLLATERSRKPHDGIVDALLMAEYCRRKFGGHGG